MNPAVRTPARTARTMVLSSVLAALSTAGCATTDAVRYGEVVAVPAAYNPVERPLSIGEIAAELRRGRPQHDLAYEIRARGLLAPLTEDDIDLLVQLGADDELIDAVQDASAAPPSAMGAPPIIVTPPPVVHDYGWYPYTPYPAYGGFWYRDVPRFAPPLYRGYRPPRHDGRSRPDGRPSRPAAPTAPDWQSPRATPPSGSATQPSTRPRQPVDPRIPQDAPAPRQGPAPSDPRIPRQ